MWRQARLAYPASLLLYFLLATLTTFSPIASAQQILFQREHKPLLAQYDFHYQWLDHQNQQRTLLFSLDEPKTHESIAYFRPLSPQQINRALLQPLAFFAREQGWYQMEIRLNSYRDIIKYQPHLRDAQAAQVRINRMREQEHIERQKVLQENFLTFLTMPPNQFGIAPDHARIAIANTALLMPVASSFLDSLSGASVREYISIITSFVQAIPYNDLTRRLDSGGKGFHTPARLLLENQGDCDSKVTLLAAILKGLMPNMNMAVVYLPNHALLALTINAQAQDITIEHNGMHYVVVDPTGPAPLGVGQLSSSNALHVINGNITIKTI